MKIPTDKLNKIKRIIFGIMAANLLASVLYVFFGWQLYANPQLAELNKATPFLWALSIVGGTVGFLYSPVSAIFLLSGLSESERLLRSGKRHDTRLMRIVPYPLCSFVFGVLSLKNDALNKSPKAAKQEVIFIGIASDCPGFKLDNQTLADLRNSAPIEVTALSNEKGKLRVLTYDNSLVQIVMILPPALVSFMFALEGGNSRK